MKKLYHIICDNPKCSKVCDNNYIIVKGKKRLLHYCSEQCKLNHHENKNIIKQFT